MGGSGTPSKTTTTTEPPAFIRPYLEYGAQQAQQLYQGGGPQYYPGSTVVGFSPQTNEALQLTQQRAENGSPLVDDAQGYARGVLNTPATSKYGGAVNPYASSPNPYGGPTGFESDQNPYLDATFNRAADSVQNRLQSSFAGSGRNIGAARAPAALELGDLANTIYGGAYQQDRDRALAAQNQERNRQLAYQQQLTGIGATGFENSQNRSLDDIQQQRALQYQAAQLAPGLASNDYTDLAALQGVGGAYEDQQQQQLDDQVARFNFQQNSPQVNLDNYLQRITGSFPGATQTGPGPPKKSRAAGALGGAATGAALGSQIYPGYGTAIGAVAGGLLGAFG